jgi:quinol monooxygenase YgiN
MSVVIVAAITPLPKQCDEVVIVMQTVIAQVHKRNAGCELYALHEERDRFVIVEKWASQEAPVAHLKGSATAAMKTALDGKLGGSIAVQLLETHPSGTTAQGAL